MEMCRVCLSTEKGMQPLNEAFVIQYNLLTSLNISIMDGMPQYACETCLETVKYFKEFRDKSIASEATLRKIIFHNLKSEERNIEPKFEAQQKENLETNEDGVQKFIKIEIKKENEADSDIAADNFDATFVEYEGSVSHLVKDEDEIEKLKDVQLKKLKKSKHKRKQKKKEFKSIEKTDLAEDWICGICPKAFKEKNDWKEHLDVHKDDRQCGLCKEKSNSLSQLLAHRLTHVPPKQHKCHICNKRYKSCLYLEHHYRISHIHHDNPEVTCNICSSSFVTPKKLSSHIYHVHSSTRYYCDVCSKGFPCKTNLKSHIKQHNVIKAYVCDLCGFSCNYNSGLKDHKVRKHSQQKLNCKNCTRAFPSQEEFENHKCKEKLTICTICGLQLTGNSRMSRHMARHTTVGKYECDRCPAKFKSSSGLTAHKNRHDGNRTKQCEFCPAKFYTDTVLTKHRRTHTGEKPYVCKICSKGFTGNYNLKVHMKVHGEYLIVKKSNEPDLSNIKNIAK
ncbi:unnamed protein product [Arctia plantaginis]|uniref:Uncharacterized protein n=1 Tax=Arctia plantaginis TaxID=874455 RepID=A0A8S0YUV9_ARCPL|nr:unnamed protein product [Arctia plantaginis]CAB3247514.1 unnamed protein product [Arctia plantaginis]